MLNAIAHRDYSIEGRTTEVWFFDDRLEITSPGELPPEVSLDDLLRGERRHVSRNPRVVRALVDLGAMRDQGEGIPRMFAEMAGQFLPEPSIRASNHEFSVTLRNTPTLTADDRDFVARLGSAELGPEEFRALLEAHRHGRVDNARIRQISGLDRLGASVLLRRLRDRGLLDLHPAGGASFYTVAAALHAGSPADPGDLATDRGGFDADRGGFDADRGGFDADRGGFDADQGGGRAAGRPAALAARRAPGPRAPASKGAASGGRRPALRPPALRPSRARGARGCPSRQARGAPPLADGGRREAAAALPAQPEPPQPGLPHDSGAALRRGV